MRPSVLAALAPLAVLASACGPREPGPHANETVFWRVTAHALEWGECSDHQNLRGAYEGSALATDGSQFMAFSVDAEGEQMTELTCTAVDPATCRPAIQAPRTEPRVYTVSGHEATFGENRKATIQDHQCALALAHTRVLKDEGQAMTLTLTDSYSLVDAETDCADVEATWRAMSPNHKGLQGCTVVRTVGGTLQE